VARRLNLYRRAPHVGRFEVMSEVTGATGSMAPSPIHIRTIVVETTVDAKRLPLAWNDKDAVERVLYLSPWLPHEDKHGPETYTVCERIVAAMNRMNLAIQANDPQVVFDYLWSIEAGEESNS
jgi:hypothetical protein